MDVGNVVSILNAIREDYELDITACEYGEYAEDCENCKNCFSYKAAQALGYAINAVKFKEKHRTKE